MEEIIFYKKTYKQGGSIAITIPETIVELLKLKENDFIQIKLSKTK